MEHKRRYRSQQRGRLAKRDSVQLPEWKTLVDPLRAMASEHSLLHTPTHASPAPRRESKAPLKTKEIDLAQLREEYRKDIERLEAKYISKIEALQLELKACKENSMKHFEEELNRQAALLTEEHNRELAEYRKKLATQKKKHKHHLKKQLDGMTANQFDVMTAKQLEQKYTTELTARDKENEGKLKTQLSQLRLGYEHKIKALHEQNLGLRKQKEEIEDLLVEVQAKEQLKRITSLTPNKHSDAKRVLCDKCKAFVEMEDELNSRIGRLKSYLRS